MRICIPVLIFVFTACRSIPNEKLKQVEIQSEVYVARDSLYLEISNPVHCPLTIGLSTRIKPFNEDLNLVFPIVLPAFSDTCISVYTLRSKRELDPTVSISFGSSMDSINVEDFTLPFPKNHRYKITQGYNGDFSHNSPLSEHAIDFNLSQNDTVCAVADGYVVGVIKDYKYGGSSGKWRDYANYITLYHPNKNVISQYVHLVENGSFVAVGDTIVKGQAIGLAGKTGFTQGEHLHFNVYGILKGKMRSIAISFKEGYTGHDLKKGDWVKK